MINNCFQLIITQIFIALIAAAATMPDFLDPIPNADAADPIPHILISPFIISSLTGENAASSGSLNAYIMDRNKRQYPKITIRETQSI